MLEYVVLIRFEEIHGCIWVSALFRNIYEGGCSVRKLLMLCDVSAVLRRCVDVV